MNSQAKDLTARLQKVVFILLDVLRIPEPQLVQAVHERKCLEMLLEGTA